MNVVEDFIDRNEDSIADALDKVDIEKAIMAIDLQEILSKVNLRPLLMLRYTDFDWEHK